ncbi:DUF1707 SHOCT-like domain-containing protein [Nocardia aurantiaca]|uniref:DUF1707 SHOCT-like domain-containing protein n=1 Tax=Nocardia aurantiaca TaxID=2675850 RepID=UPI0018AA47F8|nr:DUF1707 domain-containing protein [Nocardia aurantiaca]
MSEPVHPNDIRISDVERKAAEATLRSAVDAGVLDLNEFDSRVQSIWQARTRGELAAVSADLPEAERPGPSGGRIAMTVLTIVWLSLSGLNLIVWLLLGVTLEWFYPWWVWVLVPPGAVLGTLWACGIGRKRPLPPRD